MTTNALLISVCTILFIGCAWLLRNYQSPRVTPEDLAVLDVKDCEEDHEVLHVSSKIFNRDDARRNTGRVEIYIKGENNQSRMVYHQELYPASVRQAMGMRNAKS